MFVQCSGCKTAPTVFDALFRNLRALKITWADSLIINDETLRQVIESSSSTFSPLKSAIN